MSEARVRQIVKELLELAPEERDHRLAELTRGNDALRRAVVVRLQELLADDEFLRPLCDGPTGFGAGTRVGPYQLVREIGRGGTGVVWLAHEPTLNREVAIKVLWVTPLTSEQTIERFRRESRNVAKLRHRGIASVFFVGSQDALHYFAMEYVPGQDLGAALARQREGQRSPGLPGPGEPARHAAIARIGAEVAEALEHAHAHGIVHRDVKPENLLVRPDGSIALVDFGLARAEALGSVTRTGEVAGTLHYMSPEQLRVDADPVDHRTDVFSLGVVLYEIVTLTQPFRGCTSQQVIAQIQGGEPRDPRRIDAGVPRDLATICLTALEKQPHRRYQTAAAMASDLRRFLDHEPIAATSAGVVQRGARWARVHKLTCTATAVAVVVGVGAAWLGWWAADTSSSPRVDLVVRSEDAAPAAGVASFVPIDPTTGQPHQAASVDLGELPLKAARVPVGYGRIVVDVAGHGRREFTRLMLHPTDSISIDYRLSPEQTSTEDMVRIEGREFVVPEDSGSPSRLEGRTVRVPSFWIDSKEVCNADYRRFITATGYRAPEYWHLIVPGSPDDHLPVTMVSWGDARAYAEWRGKRLPTYAEWYLVVDHEEARESDHQDAL
ncbi:MAG: bifunctional serine/threonine-protein kinase/formylglycine-generating enzyme family protein [Planctomycetota bacterium]